MNGSPSSPAGSRSTLKRSIRRALGMQAARPQGLFGRVAAQVMRRANASLKLWVVDLLDLQPTDHVLEVGFGPGVALAEVLRRVPDGRIAAVDASTSLVRDARSRQADDIAAGRLDVRHGDAAALPYGDETFDKALGIHVLYFWPDQVGVARELRRILGPSGVLALGYQEEDRLPPPARVSMREAGATLVGPGDVERVMRGLLRCSDRDKTLISGTGRLLRDRDQVTEPRAFAQTLDPEARSGAPVAIRMPKGRLRQLWRPHDHADAVLPLHGQYFVPDLSPGSIKSEPACQRRAVKPLCGSQYRWIVERSGVANTAHRDQAGGEGLRGRIRRLVPDPSLIRGDEGRGCRSFIRRRRCGGEPLRWTEHALTPIPQGFQHLIDAGTDEPDGAPSARQRPPCEVDFLVESAGHQQHICLDRIGRQSATFDPQPKPRRRRHNAVGHRPAEPRVAVP